MSTSELELFDLSAAFPRGKAADTLLRFELEASVKWHARHTLALAGRSPSPHDLFRAVALALRAPILETMSQTELRRERARVKRIYYLSIEFQTGRLLEHNLVNFGLLEPCRDVIASLGGDIDEVLDAEPGPSLRTGSPGQRAARFLDSMACLDLPVYGYGIDYHHRYDEQSNPASEWLTAENPWVVERRGEDVVVPLYGRVVENGHGAGGYMGNWLDWEAVAGVPCDLPVVAPAGTVNWLRLFSTRKVRSFEQTGHEGGTAERLLSTDAVTRAPYTGGSTGPEREIRLVQEYFLIACALRDVIRRAAAAPGGMDALSSNAAIQLGDMHPGLAVAELMRLLLDEREMPWERAWTITRIVVPSSDRIHMREATETWPRRLLERVLPRHVQIIDEINRRFRDEVRSAFRSDHASVEWAPASI
jgi:glycogen phosphorylase